MQSKLPMHLSRRCRARTRGSGNPCQSPAMTNGRCRMHGGKSGSPEGIKTHLSTGDIPLLRLPPAERSHSCWNLLRGADACSQVSRLGMDLSEKACAS